MTEDRPSFQDELKLAQKQSVAGALGDAPTPATLTDIGIDAIETAETLLQRFYATDPDDGPTACAEGCTFCCHQYVGLSVPELGILAAFISRQLDKTARGAILQRLKSVRTATAGLPRFERAVAGVDCPLLDPDTRMCSVYAARPLTCRGMHSLSREACEADDAAPGKGDPIPQYESHKGITRSIAIGQQLALMERGWPVAELELGTALILALDDPSSFERWLAGENPFETAEMPPE